MNAPQILGGTPTLYKITKVVHAQPPFNDPIRVNRVELHGDSYFFPLGEDLISNRIKRFAPDDVVEVGNLRFRELRLVC